jgi:hypothetical protein
MKMPSLGQSLQSDPYVKCDRERYASFPLIIDICEIPNPMHAYNATGPLNPDTLIDDRIDYTKDILTRPSLATYRRPVGIN